MRELSTVATVIILMGATLLASSRAEAMPPAGPSALRTAIHEANTPQQVGYVCRRGGHGCYYVSRPHVRYARPYAHGETHQPSQNSPYNPTTNYWGCL
jgi:hypothetical protein